MSYIGNTPTQQNFVAGSDQFNGTGSQTVFTLSRAVSTVNDIQVVVSNVPQDPFTAYTVAGNSLTFTSAPPAGTGNVYVVYRATNVQTFIPTPGVSPSVGNLDFIGTGNRITGDFSNATIASRVLFQTSTANGQTSIGVLPNGTSLQSQISLESDSAVTNGSTAQFINVGGSDVRIASGIRGTGTYLPMTFYTGGSERMRIDTSGNLQFNSGYGSVATAYGCRAWVNFNGTGIVAIRASGNVSSITDGGVGRYKVNFTNALPDANYSVGLAASTDGTNGGGAFTAFVENYAVSNAVTAPTTLYFVFSIYQSNTGTMRDATYVCASVFR